MHREKSQTAEAFGQRLRDLMRAKGHVSDTARSGVDVAALAHAAGTSYEMARRYAEGLAVPRADTLQMIAAWLEVAPALLAWGATTGDASVVNPEILQRCIEAVTEAQRLAKTQLPPDRAARLVATLYLEAIDGRTLAPATVARMLRMMT